MTKRVPTCSVPLHPCTQEQICAELVEYVDDFLEIMKDETGTADQPTTILEHSTTKREALIWLAKFNKYFKSKGKELVNRGYRQVDHGRLVLDAYIDRELEMKLDRDLPWGNKTEIGGNQGCIERLTQYFERNGRENNETHINTMTPVDPALEKKEWLLTDTLAHHSGVQAAQGREHEHFKRRKEFAITTKLQHPASIPSEDQHTTIDKLPNEILKQICEYLPFRAVQNLIEATKELRDLSEISKNTGQAINLTGEYLEESKLREILARKSTQYLDLSKVELINGSGAIEMDIQADRPSLKGICLSSFMGPIIRIASIVSMLNGLTTLDISYSRLQLISKVSRAMGNNTNIEAINIGTSPFMRLSCPDNSEPVEKTMARLIHKCPQLQHFVLHGLNLCSFHYLHRHLPPKMKSIDIARNPKFTNDDIRHIMTQCPDLTFLDMSETSVTLQIIGELATAWAHSLISLALPNAAARHLKELYRAESGALKFVVLCIRSMSKLVYLQMGRWRMGTAPEAHRYSNGEMSNEIREEIETITALKQLFPELTIHMSPYAQEDKHFYKQNGFPKPNPNFPPPSDPHYYLRRWGRGEGNFIQE